MIGVEDAPYAYEYTGHYKILPQINGWNNDAERIKGGKAVGSGFTYASDSNAEWMETETLQNWIGKNKVGIL